MTSSDAPPRVQPASAHFTDEEDRRVITEYIESGAGDVPAQNLRDWERLRIVPRPFADVRSVDTTAAVLGRSYAAPIIVAPTHGHLLVHDEGETATAAGARDAGVPFVLSQGAGVKLASIGGPYLQQLYLTAKRSTLAPFLDAAVAAGAEAFVVTVDQAAAGGDTFRLDATQVLRRLPTPNLASTTAADWEISRFIRPADLTWLADGWGLPIIAKGILDADSAKTAVDAGVSTVVVSNHGGRQLPASISAPFVLGEIVDAVGDRAGVWADGGVRSGTDVFRALALGADAVLVGRPVVRSLAAGGARSVAEYLRSLTDELRVVMANAGTPTLGDIDSKRVRAVPRTRD